MAEPLVDNQDAGDFMARSVAEEKQTARLNQEFRDAQSHVFQTITNKVCDCGYISNSWTTRNEADVMIKHLRLMPSHDLLDIGAGAGWPGLYLAQQTGCAVTLLDLPEIGLRLAEARAEADGMTLQLSTIQGDAADMPLPSESFTAIHVNSDLLSRTGKAEVAIAREVAMDDRRAKQTESKSLADVKQPKYLTANPRNLIGWFDPAVHRARGLQGHLALVSERFIAFDQLPQTEYQLYRPRLCSAKKRMKE